MTALNAQFDISIFTLTTRTQFLTYGNFFPLHDNIEPPQTHSFPPFQSRPGLTVTHSIFNSIHSFAFLYFIHYVLTRLSRRSSPSHSQSKLIAHQASDLKQTDHEGSCNVQCLGHIPAHHHCADFNCPWSATSPRSSAWRRPRSHYAQASGSLW